MSVKGCRLKEANRVFLYNAEALHHRSNLKLDFFLMDVQQKLHIRQVIYPLNMPYLTVGAVCLYESRERITYRGLMPWCGRVCNDSWRFWRASRLWATHQSLQCFHVHTEILELVLVASEYPPGLWEGRAQVKKMLKLECFHFTITNIISFFFLLSPPKGLCNFFSHSCNWNHRGLKGSREEILITTRVTREFQ